MRAAVVERDDLDIQMVQAAVGIDVLDARIRELHVPIGVGQVVLGCPFSNLGFVAIRPAVTVGAAAIPLLEELLILALELVVQNDALDACAARLEALRFALVRAVDLRVVLDLARLLQVRVERLAVVAAAVAIATVRLEQIAPALGQHDDVIAVAVERHGPNKTLLPQVPEIAFAWVGGAVVVVTQIARRDDTEGADDAQRAGFRTAKACTRGHGRGPARVRGREAGRAC